MDEEELPRVDSNHNTQIQNLMSYRLDDRAEIYPGLASTCISIYSKGGVELPGVLLQPLVGLFKPFPVLAKTTCRAFKRITAA